jgi:HSP20 family molecular chaperone IbpA
VKTQVNSKKISKSKTVEMSLRPFFENSDNWLDWMNRYHRQLWDLDRWTYPGHMLDFGMGIPSNRLRELLEFPRSERLDQLMREADQEIAPQTGKDGFQVCLDVQQFKPNEISVKTVENQVVIEGKHEERQDQHGFISRQFTRRYTLPKGYKADKVVSTLSSDGVLTIKASPPQEAIEAAKERVIQIQQTGPARHSIKANQKEEEKD